MPGGQRHQPSAPNLSCVRRPPGGRLRQAASNLPKFQQMLSKNNRFDRHTATLQRRVCNDLIGGRLGSAREYARILLFPPSCKSSSPHYARVIGFAVYLSTEVRYFRVCGERQRSRCSIYSEFTHSSSLACCALKCSEAVRDIQALSPPTEMMGKWRTATM